MPRGARLDAPGTLHHVIIRGIERRQIVDDDNDRENFVSRLGEIALVPHSSPISQSGLLFYNTLIDENAASHIGLGKGLGFCMENNEAMSEDEFASLGGNDSIVHVDFMIGSGEMDVDGFAEDGTAEPLMRGGEWTFEP